MNRSSTPLASMLLVPALVLAVCFPGYETTALGAEDSDPVEQTAPKSFRRLFVPADSPEEWPVGGQRFLPLSQAEFSRLIASARGHSEHNRQPAQVRIKSAHYSADLQTTDQMRVSAELEVELLNEQPRLLPIAEFNLSILSAAWRESSSERATMGLWQEYAASVPAVLVERPGTLKIEGLLAATSSSNARKEFTFTTPAIVPQILELQLAENQSAEVTHAELLSKELIGAGESRWSFQLSPQGSHRIVVTQMTSQPRDQELPFLSQSSSYRIESTRLELLTELRLDGSASSITTVEAVIPAGTRVVDVSLDQQEAEWKVVYQQGRQLLVVDRPRTANPQTVGIRSLSKLRLGADWELPKLRVQGVKWTEGTVRLLVSPDLQLQSILPSRCSIQHVLGIDDAVGDGEAYRLQEWSSNAAIVLRLARPKPRLRVATLTDIELTSTDTKAKLRANFSNSQGKIYQVRAAIDPEWEVQSVTSTNGSAIREWHVDRTESSSTLYCQLSDSISQEQPLWLEIEARNALSQLALTTSVGRLKVLRFLNVEHELDLLSLRATTPRKLVPAIRHAGVSNGSIDFPRELPTNFSELIDSQNVGRYFDVSSVSDATVIELGRQAIRYRAEIFVEAQVESDSLTHEFHLDFSVEAGELSEILIETRLPLPDSIAWEIADRRVAVTSERVLAAESSDPLRPDPNQYLLKFSSPMTTDFQLRAEYSQPTKVTSEVNLIQLPDSVRWEGHILVRGSLAGIAISDQGFVPSFPVDSSARPSPVPVLGGYRFGPKNFRRDSGRPPLRIERQRDSGASPKLVAWAGEYQTVQSAEGDGLHAANFFLESCGSHVASLKLPDEAKLLEVWLNDQQIDLSTVYNAQDEIKLSLDHGEIWHQIGLRYSTTGAALGGSAKIQPILPNCSFPVYQSRWTLWAPVQYEIDRSQLSYSSQDYHWWKRVFGPLARSRHEGIFNPVSSTRWSELWNAPLVVQESKQLAGVLATSLAERIQREPERTLGEVISEVVELNELQERVLVDRSAMLAKRLLPEVPCKRLNVTERTDAPDLALTRPLASFDLALLVSSNTLVLTTTERVAHWSDRLRPTRLPGVYLSASDSLSEDLSRLKRTDSPDFVSVPNWRQLASERESRWNDNALNYLGDVGRQAQTVPFSRELPTLVVRQAHVQRSLWYAVLLLTIVFGVWQLAHFPNAMILLGALAGSACLLAPISWLTIPQAVFLGLVAAALIRVVFKSGEVLDLRRKAGRPVALSIFGTLLLNGSISAEVLAQESNALQSQRVMAPNLPKVLIPIDSQGNRQGEDVYLPEGFFESLRGESKQQTTQVAGAVVLAAQYDARLPTQKKSSALNDPPVPSDMWTIKLKLETHGPNQEVKLPFLQSEAAWMRSAHRLDGLPVEIAWNKSGGCSLVVLQPGIHRLHLVCQPRYTMTDGAGVLRLRAPVVPGARLQLLNTPAFSQIKVAGAELPSRSSPDNLKEFVLGSSEEINISWQSVSPASEKSLWDRIEKSCWLTVNPVSATLDVQFRVIGNRGGLPGLSLDVPSQLQLLAPAEESVVSRIVIPDSSRPGRAQLVLKPNLPEDFVISLKFDFKRRIGIGQIYFPEVRLAGMNPDLHRFAVSVASGLSYDERGSAGLRTLETTEFLENWDRPTSAPLFAYAIDRQLPTWSLRVWPDPRSLRTQQAMRLECGVNRVSVEALFSVEELAGSWHIHRLRVPESLEIDEITVRDSSDTLVVSRWSRASPSDVSIFLSRPISEAHSISVRGSLRNSPGRSLDIPRIELVDGGRGQVFMDLYRDEAVQLEWTDPASAPEQSDLRKTPNNKNAIYVGSFEWRQSTSSRFSQFSIRTNDVAFSTSSATSLERATAGWEVRLSSRIRVQHGILNRLRISLPENVRPPFRLQSERSAAIQDVIETADDKQLTVLLAKSVGQGEKFSIQLSGSLNLPVDRRLVLPSLRWNGATRSDRYVLLPTLVAGEAITWQRTGLRRQALPLSLVEVAMPGEHAHCFRIEEEEFTAEQRDSFSAMRNARVRHAKVSGFLDTNGEFVANAEMFIQLGRATSCALQLPKQAEVFQLVVGDRPVRRERGADGTWKLPVGPPFLPQRILVSYRCPTKISGRQVHLEPPRMLLGDKILPLPEVSWQIRAPLNLMLAASDVSQLTPSLEVVKSDYQVSLQIVDEAFSQVLKMPRDEGRAWVETWRKVIRKAEQALREHRSEASQNSELAAAAETLLAIEDAFANENAIDQTVSPMLRYPVARRGALDVVAKRNEYFFVSEAGGPLVVERSFGSQQSPWQWLVAVMFVGGVLAAVLRLKQHPECYHDLCHWPHSLAIGLGFAWWLLLSPSVFGLAVIGLALVSLMLRAWRSYRSDQAESVATRVLPSSS